MSSLKYLKFDSDLFGYEVAAYEVRSLADLQNPELSKFKLVYIQLLNDHLIDQVKEKIGPLYIKVSLHTTAKPVKRINSYISEIHNFSETLLDLTLQSGVYSRFKVDPKFSTGEYEKLYRLWIEKSINRQIAEKVYGYFLDNILVGFITLSIKENACNIGLIAVDEKYRGKKIGEKLVQTAHAFANEVGVSKVTVDTQQENTSAMKFYQKIGFEPYHRQKTFHLWNK